MSAVVVTAAVNDLGRDPLAYEIRRISGSFVGAASGTRELPPPGELAIRLARSFGLRGIDVDIALAVLASHVDHDFAVLLQSTAGRSELGVLAVLLPRLEDRLAYADAVGPNAPIVRARLLRRTEVDGIAVLAPTRRFRTAVFGQHVFSSLPSYAERVEREPAPVAWVSAPTGLLAAMQRDSSGLCVVRGGTGCGKTSWARHAAFSIAGAALRIDTSSAARNGAFSDIRELIEDAAMLGWPVILDNLSEVTPARLIEEALESTPAKMFVVIDEIVALDPRIESRAVAHVHVSPPPASIRRELWAAATTTIPTTVADDIILTPRQIHNAIALVRGGADPVDAAFEQLPRNRDLALPDRTSARLDALVLPAEVRVEVEEIIDAIRARGAVNKFLGTRGRAISALFNGDSGTGKTFTCEVIAAEVGLPLLRVNVATLVDKYIGETEKNLARVFAQAQAQGGILFFDEADALFGNRTEVSRAQDRYTNLETNLLLQLMEQFAGIVLLTTNLKQNIDPAFMRRIMFKVYFDPPDAPERVRLWQKSLPFDCEEDVDFDGLARAFELSGGSIRAAALRAAYRAAAGGRPIAMDDLVDCAQLEVQGMGRVATW